MKNIKKIRKLIEKSNGKFFSAKFIKKDGSIREGIFRLGVKKYIKGIGLAYNPNDYNLVCVWESKNKEGFRAAEAYRMLNLKTIIMLKIGGIEFNF